MKLKVKLLIVLGMISLTLNAQEEVLIKSIQGSEHQLMSSQIEFKDVEFEQAEDKSATEMTESNNSVFQISAIHKKEGLKLEMDAIPLEDEESIMLSIDEFDGLNYTLSDLDGRILEANPIVSVETPVEFVYLIPSDYFIEVSTETEVLKKFKVIKK